MRAVAGDHDNISFAARWRHKDARYGLELAADVGHAMPTSTLGSSRRCSRAAGALHRSAIWRPWRPQRQRARPRTRANARVGYAEDSSPGSRSMGSKFLRPAVFKWQRPLFDPFRLLHPQPRTVPTGSVNVST